MKNAEIKFRCTEELKEKASIAAEKTGRTLSSFITFLMEKEIDNMNIIDKKELETKGIKLGEIDFNNYMGVYAGTRTYYLYRGNIYMSSYNVNQLCYTGDNGTSIHMDNETTKKIVSEEYDERLEEFYGITEEMFQKLKSCFN